MVIYKRDGEVIARQQKTSYGYNFERGSMLNGEFVPTMTFHLHSDRELFFSEKALGKVEKEEHEETPCPRTGKVWQ